MELMEFKDSTVFKGIIVVACFTALFFLGVGAGNVVVNQRHASGYNVSYVKCGPAVYYESGRVNPTEAVEETQTKVKTPKPVEKHSAVNEMHDPKSFEKSRSVAFEIISSMILLLVCILPPIIAIWSECRDQKRQKKPTEKPTKKIEQINSLEEAKKKVLESLS